MSGGYLGCCPDIVRGPKGSVIEPFTGYRGNVAIIVDWGYHRRHWRRPCTPSDHGFMYVNFCVNAYEWLSLSQHYLVLAIIYIASLSMYIATAGMLTGETVHTILELKRIWGHSRRHINIQNMLPAMGWLFTTVVTLEVRSAIFGDAVTTYTRPFMWAMILSTHSHLEPSRIELNFD